MESLSVPRRRRSALVAVLALAVVAGLLAVAPPATADDCGIGFVTDVRHGAPVCLHGSEPPPAGIDLGRLPSTGELAERRLGEGATTAGVAAATVTTSALACLGTGGDGPRIQAIYARASDVADRYDAVAALIAQYAADVDYQINVSAGLSGTGRRVRFATTPACELDIARVTLTPSGDDSFSAMRTELRAQGFDRDDRKYLVWADAAVGICGLGEMYSDDSVDAGNLNNLGPSYARVDAPCWDYAEAHELIHTLGGVQDSAPHSTGAGHCTDENDTMCYRDTSGIPTTSVCPSLPSWHVDCNLDDYFNAAPAAASYLATHWNVANNVYLEGAEPLPPAPSISLSAPSSFYAGNAVSVSASPNVPAGRTYTITWTTTRTDCRFARATGATNVFTCPVTAAGSGEIIATVLDSAAMSSDATRVFSFAVPSSRRGTTLGLGLSTTRVRRGRAATIRGRLLDRASGKALFGMPVAIYARAAGSTRWTRIAVRTTRSDGTIALAVRPSRTTDYRLVSAYTRTWASGQSATKRLTVR